MVKVITYGTYDLLHYGHLQLLKRAKALGDYLIVGVTSEVFDKARGKINVQQSLMERIAGVRETGLADEIIVEEYEGQKIDDIRRYGADIFTVGSDWMGKFDYLKEFCTVIYLPRTDGISSTDLRTESSNLRIGFAGSGAVLKKYRQEADFVNGLESVGVCTQDAETWNWTKAKGLYVTDQFDELLEKVDMIYLVTHPDEHYLQSKRALLQGKHVLCEAPVTLRRKEYDELRSLAESHNLVFMDANKTAYATAYNRLLLLLKDGRIGDILAVDSTCTSLMERIPEKPGENAEHWNSICAWGPTAMLPVFQILGVEFREKTITSFVDFPGSRFDLFTRIDFLYSGASASLKVGKGIKSEGELIISGTKGYIYVPAPWWKTDYFEIRYENPAENRRYFYQLDGEGIRYELLNFAKAVRNGGGGYNSYIEEYVTREIVGVVEDFYKGKDVRYLSMK